MQGICWAHRRVGGAVGHDVKGPEEDLVRGRVGVRVRVRVRVRG